MWRTFSTQTPDLSTEIRYVKPSWVNFSQVWLEGEPCHCSCAYGAAHYSKTCSYYKKAGFSCWLLPGIPILGSSSHRRTAPNLSQGATEDISFLLPMLVNMQGSPAAEWVLTGKIKSDPLWHNTLFWSEGVECSHKKEQVTTWLAHSFHEWSHGWVSTEIWNSSTLLCCVLPQQHRTYLIFSVAFWNPLPFWFPLGDRGKEVLSLQISLVLGLSHCCCCSSQSRGGLFWNCETCTESALQVLWKFEVKATSASWCVAGSWALEDWSSTIM